MTKKIFGILAFPAGHSLSPMMHRAGFEELGLPYDFEAWDIPPEKLAEFMNELHAPVEGFSVSMPHKEAIIPYLHKLDEAGEAVGAVSCVYMREGKYIGTNLDYMGVRGSLEASSFAAKGGLKGKKVVIIGAGGAAKAAVYGVLQLGMIPMIFNRTREKAEAIGAQFEIEGYALDEIRNKVDGVEIIINCTSLGLNADTKAVPDEVFARMKLSLDAVYSHTPTIFQIQSKEAGAETLTGLEWLLHQGYGAFELWTGLPSPKEAMSKAVREAIKSH